jgi:hypothetical protein
VIKKLIVAGGTVAHASDSSHLGSSGRRIMVQSQPGQKHVTLSEK